MSKPGAQQLAAESAIRAMVDRETAAWNALDANALVDLIHPDAVWPWPPDPSAHDPLSWVMPMGRFNRQRWLESWQQLFADHALVHNRRQTLHIRLSDQGDGGFAVVDVDTLWKHKTSGALDHWQGRACKVYTRVGDRWYFIHQTGLLRYGS